ncbi:Protein of unknown function [Hymenobacter daecheongensis DSM 21074]|uniref:DUF262 domain-containing protein n=1 Tax=Hymenobacter daecheongensis DSM 21074 TaxID=1121955 RepID=A0A1M6EY22_9BACT|nr:DUF262 domain-containing protein [Hymenobacter daecheongensis]SHI90343.1 Protein of unknown function [Hymenobacter daecheongensis DSM 21074]
MKSASIPEEYSIRDLFGSGHYVIPLYQRNYAWTEQEVLQLIQDVADYALNKPNTRYRIGTLIAYERESGQGIVRETIDGQQRLTTLNILLCALKREYAAKLSKQQLAQLTTRFQLNLQYDSRPSSTETLRVLFQEGPLRFSSDKTYNTEIRQAYEVAVRSLRHLPTEKGISVSQFFGYLLDNVSILFVTVPPDTDLNHYFEIMNSRGEQLEKHEVLKAQLLNVLREDHRASHCFNRIWEACAHMERYVQYGFVPDVRTALFGNEWSLLRAGDFEAVAEKLYSGQGPGLHLNEYDLDSILSQGASSSQTSASKSDSDDASRFTAVINFPNFLLHILRIQVADEARRTNEAVDAQSQVRLDDKDLLDAFNAQLNKALDQQKFVQDFAYNLLRGRNLFDTFVLKREYDNTGDGWSLKAMKKSSSASAYYADTFGDDVTGLNREVLMLLAMFHVSNPTQIYKHWLSGALNYLFAQQRVTAHEYRNYLQRLANGFLFNRYLTDAKQEYYEMIFTPHGLNRQPVPNEALLHQGTGVENFVFNYLDFLLWKRDKAAHKDFEFTFRSSVEHYYPQHPLDAEPLPDKYLHHFGNLCLISSSKNSALRNYLPWAKKDHYIRVRPDSLKQRLMMDLTTKECDWNVEAIKTHGQAMKDLLLAQRHGKGISLAVLTTLL